MENQSIMLKDYKTPSSYLGTTTLKNNRVEEDDRSQETIASLRQKIALIQDNHRNQITNLQNRLLKIDY